MLIRRSYLTLLLWQGEATTIYLESKTVQGTEHTKPTQQTDQTYADYVHNA